MDGNEIKLVTFADDMTFVRAKQSHQTILSVISLGRYSGHDYQR